MAARAQLREGLPDTLRIGGARREDTARPSQQAITIQQFRRALFPRQPASPRRRPASCAAPDRGACSRGHRLRPPARTGEPTAGIQRPLARHSMRRVGGDDLPHRPSKPVRRVTSPASLSSNRVSSPARGNRAHCAIARRASSVPLQAKRQRRARPPRARAHLRLGVHPRALAFVVPRAHLELVALAPRKRVGLRGPRPEDRPAQSVLRHPPRAGRSRQVLLGPLLRGVTIRHHGQRRPAQRALSAEAGSCADTDA